jgi:hypothetical protein
MSIETMTEDAIAGALIAELEERAAKNGFRSILGGDAEVSGALAASGNMAGFSSTTDTEAIIYSTDTGEPRFIPATYLRKTLSKRRGGKAAFVAGDPRTGAPISPVPEYVQGKYMCFLHPDHEGRAELEEMGIGRDVVCGSNETNPAAHIPTEFALRMHESRRHPISYAIREEYRARKEREEDREERRRNTEAMLAMAQQASGGGTRQKAN